MTNDTHDKPTAEQLLAEAVKVIKFYGDESNYAFKLDERESIVTVIESEEGQLARDFLAKVRG